MADFQPVLEFHQILKAEQGAGTLIVTPQGEAFGFRYADIQTEYNRIYPLFDQPEIRNLVIDFRLLSYVDSTFVGVCISLAKRVAVLKGKTLLCGINDDVRDLLKKAQLIENDKFTFLWSEESDRDAAVRQLAGS